MIRVGDRVNIILSCGTPLEGIVKGWGTVDENGFVWHVLKSTLATIKTDIVVNVQHIAAFEIVVEDVKPVETKDEVFEKEVQKRLDLEIQNRLNNKAVTYEEELVIEEPILDPNLRTKKLAELRILQSKAKREEVKKHLSRTDLCVKEISYGIPSFKKHTGK
jgi:hypothetical protein